MSEVKTHILLFFLPLIIGNILHMIVVKKNLFSALNVPLSTGLFGKNKTWRGFVVLPLLTGLIAFMDSIWFGPITHSSNYDLYVGVGLGLVYMLSELPNSYIKRKIGIANGEQSNKFKYFQIFMDKSDSLIGILIFYYLAVPVSLKSVVIIFLVALGIHFGISYFLVLIKVKRSL